nr:reverse transcriptase domain-containing protein [Tanacetum cinerariifolium]
MTAPSGQATTNIREASYYQEYFANVVKHRWFLAGVWPTDENEARTLRMKIGQYIVKDEVLFKKSYLSPMLRCVGPMQANYIIRDVHEGACGMHAGASPQTAEDPTHIYHVFVVVLSMGPRHLETPPSGTQQAQVHYREIGMPTYRTIHFNESQNEEEMRLNLDLSQERRETAAIREAKYKKKVEQYYNKRVRPISFKVGDFVYRKNAASRVENQGKLGPNWEGPYRVIEAYDNGSYKLATMKDREPLVVVFSA